jgi:DNA-binding XRE family transcriptional regulator
MIKNDWQLRVIQKRIKEFEDALFELSRLPDSAAQPWLRVAQRESLESELMTLNQQLAEYELLKAGKIVLPGPEVIEQVSDVLIKTRISKGLNQEQLAARLGVSKQCVQQYEQTNYAHVTLSTAHKVLQVLLAPSETPTAGPAQASDPVAKKTSPARKAATGSKHAKRA